ncbi:MAG: phospholipid/cholesterol/gamma-HCH transport system substrate-binding protein [Sphingobacteriales bacterium]
MKISKEAKVGIFATIAAAVFIGGFSYLNGKNVFNTDKKFYANYDRIDGLAISNPVLVNGFQVGRVSDIDINPGGSLLVEILVKGNVPVPLNATAKIMSSDLMGSKAISLVFDPEVSALASSGDTLPSIIEMSLSESVNLQVLPIKNKAEKMLGTMDSVLASINYVISPSFAKNVEKSFKSLNAVVENLESTSSNLDSFVTSETGQLQTIISNLKSITTSIESKNKEIASMIGNLEQITDEVAKADIKNILDKANTSVDKFSTLMTKIENGEGSVGALLNDKDLYNNLRQASLDLDLLLVDIQKNPKRYVGFSLIGKK